MAVERPYGLNGAEWCQEDFECSICLELLCEPLLLPCGHVFCRRCLTGSLKSDNQRCALCRSSIPEGFDAVRAPSHKPLQQKIMRHCTVEYEQRLEDVALEAARLVRLRIGNKYNLVSLYPRPKHEWSVEVDLEVQPDACLPADAAMPDIIKHVGFELPAACRVVSAGSADSPAGQQESRCVQVVSAPFQVTATSPMSCTIPIVITWQDWIGQPPLRLEHDLNFQRGGGCWDYGVDLHAAFTNDAQPHAASSLPSQREQTRSQVPHWRTSLQGVPDRLHDVCDGITSRERDRRRPLSMALKHVKDYLPRILRPRRLAA